MEKILKSLVWWVKSPYWVFFPPKVAKVAPPVWVPQPVPRPVKYYKKNDWRKGIKKNVSVIGPKS
jgi:hypothetical protein